MPVVSLDVRTSNADAIAKLIADAGQLSTALDKVSNGVGTVGKSLGSFGSIQPLGSIFGTLADQAGKAGTDAATKFHQAFGAVSNSAGAPLAGNVFETFGAQISAMASGLVSAEPGVANLTAGLIRLAETSGILSKETTGVIAQVSRLSELFLQGTINEERFTNELQATKTAASTISFQQLTAGIAQFARMEQAARNAASGTQGLTQGFGELVKVVQIGLGPLSGVASRISAFSVLLREGGPAVTALGVSVIGLAAAFEKAFTAGKEYNDFQATLNAELSSVGKGAGFTAGELNALVDTLQKTTAIDSTQIRGAISALLTFPAISGEQFSKTLNLAAGVATVFSEDLPTAVRRFARALEDPQQGMSALTRLGVRFSEVQKEQIKQFESNGNLVGAQNIVLAEAAKHYGDIAQAAGKNSFAGAVNDLNANLRDLFETIGVKSGLLAEMQQHIHELTASLKDAEPAAEALGKTFTTLFSLGTGSLSGIFKNADFIGNSLAALTGTFAINRIVNVVSALAKLPQTLGLIGPAAAAAGTGLEAAGAGAEVAAVGFTAALTAAAPYITLLGLIAAGLYTMYQRQQQLDTTSDGLVKQWDDQASALKAINDEIERRSKLGIIGRTLEELNPLNGNSTYLELEAAKKRAALDENLRQQADLRSKEQFDNAPTVGVGAIGGVLGASEDQLSTAQEASDKAQALRDQVTEQAEERAKLLADTIDKLRQAYDKLGQSAKTFNDAQRELNTVKNLIPVDVFEREQRAINDLNPATKAANEAIVQLFTSMEQGATGGGLAQLQERLTAVSKAQSAGINLTEQQISQFVRLGTTTADLDKLSTGLLQTYLRLATAEKQVQQASLVQSYAKDQSSQLDLLKEQLRTIDETNQQRQISIDFLKEEQNFTKQGITLTDQQRVALHNYISESEQAQQGLAKIEATNNELANAADTTFSQVTNSITDAFIKGKASAVDFQNIFKGVMTQISGELLKLAVENPLKNLFLDPKQQLPTLHDVIDKFTGGDKSKIDNQLTQAQDNLATLNNVSTAQIQAQVVNLSGGLGSATGTGGIGSTTATGAVDQTLNNPVATATIPSLSTSNSLGCCCPTNNASFGAPFGTSPFGPSPLQQQQQPPPPAILGSQGIGFGNLNNGSTITNPPEAASGGLSASLKSALTPTNVAIAGLASGVIGSLGSLLGETIGGNAGRAIEMAAQLTQMIIQTGLLFAILINPEFLGFKAAQGAAFSGGGMRSFGAGDGFTNSIVSTPTTFSYGGGRRGQMGERGPEAIMPLTRGSDGSLGVRAHGGGDGGGSSQAEQPDLHFFVIDNAGVSIQPQQIDEQRIALIVDRRVVKSMATGGAIDQGLQTHYVIRRKGSSR